MPAWRECKLGDLLEIKHGYAFLGKHFANAGSHIVLTPGSFYDEGGFRDKAEKEKWYNGPIPAEYVLDAGDIVVAMTEQAEGLLGSSAIIPRSGVYLHNQRLGLVRLRDETKTDRRFVYYLFNTKSVRQQIRASASGVKVRHTAPTRIAEVRVRVPPFPAQRWIASILSSYDDLIENNTRRIKILEQMVQMLYREWFVNFRFPGHEQVGMVDSELRQIPQGWRLFSYSEMVESALGGDWGCEESNDEEQAPVRIIRGTDFDDLRAGNALRVPRRFISEASLRKRKLAAGDIVVENSVNAKTRCAGSSLLVTEGMLNRLEEASIAASFCRVFRPKNEKMAPIMTLHMQRLHREGGMSFYQNVAANGIANFQTTRFLETERIALPSTSDDLDPLLEKLEPFMSSNPADRIYNLRTTRDLLLPKLVSGEISVEQIETETAAQTV